MKLRNQSCQLILGHYREKRIPIRRKKIPNRGNKVPICRKFCLNKWGNQKATQRAQNRLKTSSRGSIYL